MRTASVGDFWMDETPVTNAQFARFVRETGHVTFAERPPDPADYPDMDPGLAAPGSAVFVPPPPSGGRVPDLSWWRFVLGADWRHPLGPEDSIEGRARHPVVHVSYKDALAYASWAGKVLPTEAEWEFAARGGLTGREYAWGDELHPGGRRMARTWLGVFPLVNEAPADQPYTSPVKSFPANPFGLYDLIGNVWEWTADDYTASPDDGTPPRSPCCGASGPPEPARKVVKGGSHLCAPNYCQRYRPAARWPQPVDTTTSHVGFRCIIRV